MNDPQPTTMFRKDYTVFDFTIETIDLCFQLYSEYTRVIARTVYQRNPASAFPKAPLFLFGELLELESLKIDGQALSGEQYHIDEAGLTIEVVPDSFTLEVVTRIYPHNNSALEGLYLSSGNYCTQCEAEGFRKITYYPDRPDVLARFTTRIEGDESRLPIMLSNGNLIESGSLGEGRHYATWEDPFPKPCYLFALVAGRLVSIQDQFTTRSGRNVDLYIYVEERNKDKCDHAMVSLKKSMQWDEEVFGLEYDLDRFMIVAVDDFNMGAMENKGLNVFNSKYVLASQDTATDQDYLGIEGVIGHEYFHNWTGNRVTCRDWFQLSLKEGLTVFRDQQFSADMNSAPVQRIDDVRILKNVQFKEDSGPMAHPIRPDSYVEINNFYTATVYNKGAEVIRMMHTILGAENFRRGMDLYFQRHDGQAVTCEDFVAAMSDASGTDLSLFRNWYRQSGTPVLTVSANWKEDKQELVLTVHQSCPDTPGQTDKKPFHIPIKIGLLAQDGSELSATTSEGEKTDILHLTEREQQFIFHGLTEKPVLSFLRDFSAPVRVQPFQSHEELAHLMANDPNLFNRWDASQRLSGAIILETATALASGHDIDIDATFSQAVTASLDAEITDKALLALSLQLPGETTLAQEMDVIDPDNLHAARKLVKARVAQINKAQLLKIYKENNETGPYSIDPESMAARSLKNTALSYLVSTEPLEEQFLDLCLEQYRHADNMTDTIAALGCLVNIDKPVCREAVEEFYLRWKNDPLVLDKWFASQALSTLPDTLERVKKLMEHSGFSPHNPNKIRSLIGTFCSANHVRFHAADGSGYSFLADRVIELNIINPQIAARLLGPLLSWRRYDKKRQELMTAEQERILAQQGLSRDVYEIIAKSLKA